MSVFVSNGVGHVGLHTGLSQTPAGSAALVFALPFLFLLDRFDVAVELQGPCSFTEHTALVPVGVAISGSGGSRVTSSEPVTATQGGATSRRVLVSLDLGDSGDSGARGPGNLANWAGSEPSAVALLSAAEHGGSRGLAPIS